jgi:hypothetical protein
MRIGHTLIALLLGLAACTGTDAGDVEDDPVDEQVVGDDKADAYGYVEGTPEAIGILRVANELTDAQLAGAGVTKRARNNIVANRPFTTLAELDATPYVGSVTFGKLLAYAQANGYIPLASDPFDPTSCAGPAMTQTSALTHFLPGADYTSLGAYAGPHIRRRTCNGLTGCGPWSTPWVGGVGDIALGVVHGEVVMWLRFPPSSTHVECALGDPVNCPNKYQGVLTDNCLRLARTDTTTPNYTGTYTETEYVVLSTIAPGCTPTTCAGEHATCGPVSDGCGADLDCGSCGAGLECRQNRCVASCQCTGGRVCCPGHSGCWDACSPY